MHRRTGLEKGNEVDGMIRKANNCGFIVRVKDENGNDITVPPLSIGLDKNGRPVQVLVVRDKDGISASDAHYTDFDLYVVIDDMEGGP